MRIRCGWSTARSRSTSASPRKSSRSAEVIRRALLLGALAGAIVASFAILLANAVRCIDSPEFYDATVLVWVALGTGATVTGSIFIGADRVRLALPFILGGLIAIAYAIVGPAYKACGQFFSPV